MFGNLQFDKDPEWHAKEQSMSKLYFGNLNYSVSDATLEAFLRQFDVAFEKVYIVRDSSTPLQQLIFSHCVGSFAETSATLPKVRAEKTAITKTFFSKSVHFLSL